mmetsp:Transcript_6562/g.19755  ORF Transcript_6562/g.19755 Transcript_6562/m.19755 type:complete len:96 (-) Transcript_6562:784-1071(-)
MARLCSSANAAESLASLSNVVWNSASPTASSIANTSQRAAASTSRTPMLQATASGVDGEQVASGVGINDFNADASKVSGPAAAGLPGVRADFSPP